MTADDVRRRVRDRIHADLRPVRPLRDPWVRAMAFLPVALLLLAAMPLVLFHVRTDVDRIPFMASWGASLLQVGAGLAVAVFACRQVVPGRWASVPAAVAWLGLGVAVVCAVMAVTWGVSAVRMPPGLWREGAVGCFRQSTLHGLPLLVVGLVLAARGLPARPALTGALVGLAAGVMADAAWRMVCVVTEPAHVLPGHLGAVLALSLAGGVLLSLWRRLRP